MADPAHPRRASVGGGPSEAQESALFGMGSFRQLSLCSSVWLAGMRGIADEDGGPLEEVGLELGHDGSRGSSGATDATFSCGSRS
jgi:hypothetical protein